MSISAELDLFNVGLEGCCCCCFWSGDGEVGRGQPAGTYDSISSRLVLVVVIGATSISENWRSFGGRVQRRPSPFPCFRAPLFDPWKVLSEIWKKNFRNVLVRHFLPSLGFYVQMFCVTTSMLLFSPLSFALVKYFPKISRCAHTQKKEKNHSFLQFSKNYAQVVLGCLSSTIFARNLWKWSKNTL